MKILITGGAGFIGSHLAQYLVKNNHQVFILDDLSSGSLNNIAKIHSSLLHFQKGSILDERVLEKIIDSVDVIYHLAAVVGVQLVVKHPLKTMENNVKGTENVLKIANKKRKKVLLTSTSEVYGKSCKDKFSENDDLIIGPTSKSRWSYACSKIVDEHLALAYFKEKKLPVVIVRLFNTVGEGQSGRYGMVMPRFIKQALNDENITIYGNGKQSRCFCYVGDVVWALKKLMDREEAVGEIYNIGNCENVTINELADRVVKLTSSKSKKIYIPYEEAYGEGFEETMKRIPDIDKINKLIGFQSKFNLDAIIERMKNSI
ncbi:nucleoside-diphosphate sugar epimerase [Candidatus Gottesmanbacteria bacterium RIFCSPHIGHO2_02_FULL_40_13]|uniref:Nucleoside-diphosphate sugar epimerase n=1 Tax=Candidatus Gottesmanbacteria bacterium RIFCSPHIGHO2_02_FULL_40_13 TaxID=1798384 RepID=A0A1F6A9E6_9BACT|nr:MAG: nucleoside-diphosphate sugar epimerase [Candidatus Gottesmanbacteria bacterium RIFCSPHIGHO2_02_FULL_40_13]